MARPGHAARALSFNQDQGCFTCCLDTGVRIYNVEPLAEKTRYNLEEVGDVVKCEMLYRSNLLFLVRRSKDNTLMVFDDAKRKFIAELPFPSSIKSIRLRKDRIAVVLEYSIYLVRWPCGSKISQVLTTPSNPTGLCDITSLPNVPKRMLVAPGNKVGQVQFLDTESSAGVNVLSCHKENLRCLSLSADGTCLATASDRGTLLRVWCTRRRVLLHTLRRGHDHATLFCLNFSRGGEFLCCCSDKGTLHVFQLGGTTNSSSKFGVGSSGFLGSGVFKGDRPLASGAIPREQPALCAFINNTSVVAICVDGSFHKYVFTNDGSCHREAFDIFLQVGDDDDFIV